MSDQSRRAQLEALDAKLKAHRQVENAPHIEEHYSQAQIGWRMVTELVAGLLIGAGVGYGLDVLVGTSPWMFIIFVLLGFVAGVKTMLATAQELQSGLEGTGAETPTHDEGERRGRQS